METIVEFKGGQLVLQEGVLKPDARRGLIRVSQDESGLAHFLWLERDASGAALGEPEKDIVVFPGEASFSKIARPGSRVFELRFPAERQRNLFFWAQEATADQDDDYVAAVNFALNQAGMEEGEGGGAGGEGPEGMEQDEPAAAATPAAAAAAAAAEPLAGRAAAGGGGGGAIGAADLAAVLGNILAGGLQQRQQQGRQGQGQGALDVGPSLSDVLRPEALAPLLRSPDMVERLAPFLPEGHRSAAAVGELVSTPQFRHQLEQFSQALATGQLDTSQFGLPPGGGFGVLDFLRSIQRQADTEAAAAHREAQPHPAAPGQQQQQQQP